MRCHEDGAMRYRGKIDVAVLKCISHEAVFVKTWKEEKAMTAVGEATYGEAVAGTRVTDEARAADERARANLQQLCSSLLSDLAGLREAVVSR